MNKSLLEFDLTRKRQPPPEEQEPLWRQLFTKCNTKWWKTSWLGIVVYVTTLCLQYVIGYYGIYRGFGWITPKHKPVRIFGDLVLVGWFALGTISLPWHHWEDHLCLKTRDWKGIGRFMAWFSGTIITFLLYGYTGQFPLFQSSLSSVLTHTQKLIYAFVFATIGVVVLYWCGKLYTGVRFKSCCDPPMERKIVFVRMFFFMLLLFVISYKLCSADETCEYHLHHWWFGFVLVTLSTATLDNWFDYFLQGVFWTFLIESIFNYGIDFSRFFI